MRKLALATLMVSLGLLGTASMAGATSVSLVVVGTAGTAIDSSTANSVTVNSAGTGSMTVDIQIDVDSAGLSNAALSLNFDTDNANELNIVSFTELSWTKVNAMGMVQASFSEIGGRPSTIESSATQAGQLYTFEGSSLGQGPVSTTLTFARVVFSINAANVTTDGDDLFSGIFNTGYDDMFDNQEPSANNISGTTVFGNVAVNLIPEPGTFALLSLGLGALVLSGRSRSKR
jgi:hypothetical protein